jgi:hypothetical protein
MKRTEVAREVRDALHATEASLEATLASSQATLARMIAAKSELGLTGTMGDAAIARMRESIDALERAYDSMFEGHHEAYTVLKATNIRGVASGPTIKQLGSADEDTRAA